MANHNQLKRISTTPQPNTVPYADENGYLSAWLDNDPVISALKQQTEFIGTIPTLMVGEVSTIPSGEDLQTYLSNFVYQVLTRLPADYDEVRILDVDQTWIYYNNSWIQKTSANLQTIFNDFVQQTTSRTSRNGDEVALEADGDLWLYNGTTWIYFSNTTLKDATTTSKGIMQVGAGLLVNNGLVSVDSSIYTPSRTTVTNPSTTNLSIQANTDYIFTSALTSLSLGTIANSPYFSTLTFETGNTFSWSAPSSLEYYFIDQSDIQTFFTPNTEYELVITNGKCHINYIGARQYPINKIVSISPALTPVNNIATWTITNDLGTGEVFVRVYETANGNTIEVDSTITASTITLKLYSESASISAGVYTAIILG